MEDRDPSSRWWHVPAALGAIGAGAVLLINVLFAYVGAAYRFAAGVGRPDISAFDMLPQLGPAHRFFGFAVVIVAAVGVIGTFAALIPRRTRPWAWTVPFVGVAIVAVCGVLAVLNLQDPGPQIGG